MKKQFASLLSLATFSFLLVACGDTVENSTINQMGMEVVDTEDDLPKCADDNEGEQAVVKGETFVRICIDGDWVAMSGAGGGDFSCKTVELKDKSGLKIVCNGDSIGVVLNGSNGKDGEKGKDGEDGKDAPVDTAVVDTVVLDSERIPISLDSLVGLTQKGPFLKGSTVYLYELSDGRTLKQTNGNFTSNISQDNGRYKFLARDLVSQYAMVIVDGYYRNEVTGKPSDAQIRLKAITDMRKRSSVNVNILTHLEFERVYHLVTREKYTVKQAKRKAQHEILKFFGIELGKEADAEDMDVFGSSEADAALLAISILLQGDRTESSMMALLSEMSSAMAEDSVWDDDRARAIKAEIADWAFGQKLFKFRDNVEGWGLNAAGGSVGDFEKYINNFIATTFGLDTCIAPSDTLQVLDNPASAFNGRTYLCYEDEEYGVFPYYKTRVTWVEKRENPYLNDTMEYGHMVDWRNRRMYRTITIDPTNIDKSTWMAEDLDFDYKVNGESYGSDVNRYGRSYTWAAAMDSAEVYSSSGANCGKGNICSGSTQVRGVCPEDWYLPSKSDWEKFIARVETDVGSENVVSALKASSGWGCGANGTNSFGFSAVARWSEMIPCEDYGVLPNYINYWSSTEDNHDDAYNLFIGLDFVSVSTSGIAFGKAGYAAVRCVMLPAQMVLF